MINDLILMNGYGIFVWSSFILTFLVCGIFYYKTRKTLKKYEEEFAKEINEISVEQKKIVLETLTCIKRAGANAIITYFAKDALKWMK